MTRTRGLFALLIALALAVAAASAPAQEPADSLDGLRSPTKAVLLSTAATVVPTVVAIVAINAKSDTYGTGRDDDTGPVLLITGAYFFGPAIGHFYADRPGRAFAGIGVRALAVAGMVGAFAAAWNSNGNDDSGAEGLALASLSVATFSVIYDVARAGHSARVTNEQIRARARLAPSVSAGPGSVAGAPGVRVAVRF